MRLLISDKEEYAHGDTYRLSQEQFGMREYHPFIATREWESITIELTDKTPKGIMRQLLNVGGINVIVENDYIEKANINLMQLMSEAFPDEVGDIRNLYIKDKEAFKNKVRELRSQV